jgi:hypothetical protein
MMPVPNGAAKARHALFYLAILTPSTLPCLVEKKRLLILVLLLQLLTSFAHIARCIGYRVPSLNIKKHVKGYGK